MSEEIKQAIYYGKNNVMEQLKDNKVSKIYIYRHLSLGEDFEVIKASGVPYVFVERIFLEKKSGTKEHQGIIADVTPVHYADYNQLVKEAVEKEKYPCFLLLDEVQDPNNLGAILRVADAFQISGLIIEKKRCAQLNQTVAKVSTGAINYVPVCRVGNLKNTVKDLQKKGFWSSALTMEGKESVSTFDYKQPLALIIGGEDKGVSPIMEKYADFTITIPMGGHVSSLNVATAVAVIGHQRFQAINDK